jgi:hypothetical protein
VDSALWETLDQWGLLGVLILIGIAGARKWWVFGWLYQDLEHDRNQWRTLALRGTTLTDDAIRLAADRDR